MPLRANRSWVGGCKGCRGKWLMHGRMRTHRHTPSSCTWSGPEYHPHLLLMKIHIRNITHKIQQSIQWCIYFNPQDFIIVQVTGIYLYRGLLFLFYFSLHGWIIWNLETQMGTFIEKRLRCSLEHLYLCISLPSFSCRGNIYSHIIFNYIVQIKIYNWLDATTWLHIYLNISISQCFPLLH